MNGKSFQLSRKIGNILRKKNLTIAIAESCTGGLLSSVITDVSGSSDYFLGSVVSYSNTQKEKLLRIPRLTLRRYSAVSAETSVLMAKNVKRIARSHVGIGITGFLGPKGGTSRNPRGTVYVAVVFGSKAQVVKYRFKGSRLKVKTRAVMQTLSLIDKVLS
jgi:PncC family amidohydrolase